MPTGSPLYTTLKSKNYYNDLANVTISSVEVTNGVVTFKGTQNNKEITLTLNDSSVTKEIAQEYVKSLKSVKCFKTSTENSYTINTLSDLK